MMADPAPQPDGASGARCPVCAGAALEAYGATPPGSRAVHARQVVCRGCDVLLGWPPVDAAGLDAYYARGYYEAAWPDPEAVWIQHRDEYHRHELPLWRALAGERFPRAGETAIDLGCGYGSLLRVLRADGLRVVGAEPSWQAAAYCRAQGLAVTQASSPAMPFADRRADAVLAFHVIEHVADPRALLTEMVRLVRPAGTIVIVTDNRRSSQNEWYRLRARLRHEPMPFHTSTDHTVVFGASQLSRLMREVGCETVATRGFHRRASTERLHWRLYKATFRGIDRCLDWGDYLMAVGRVSGRAADKGAGGC